MSSVILNLISHRLIMCGMCRSGGYATYLDIEYNPIELQRYGLESNVIVSGLQNFLGQRSIVGDVDRIDRDGE